MSKIDFEKGIENASRYYLQLSKYNFESSEEWIEVMGEICVSNSFGLPELMTLVHPDWYPILGLKNPRGERVFPPAGQRAYCRSEEMYGYKCPFPQQNIQVDHHFPFSKGGATVHGNAMYLCPEHNLAKSIDIHFIAWEQMERGWVSNLLVQFSHQASRKSELTTPKFDRVIKRI